MKLQIRVYDDVDHFEREETIEVPKGADRLHYCWYRGQCSDGIILSCGNIDLPRPKVKKWIWERDCLSFSKMKMILKVPMTEQELIDLTHEDILQKPVWSKVEGSEVYE
jgi:hypothetical protein